MVQNNTLYGSVHTEQRLIAEQTNNGTTKYVHLQKDATKQYKIV